MANLTVIRYFWNGCNLVILVNLLQKNPKLPVSCYSPYRTRMIFLFSEDFCSHLNRSSKEERENWLSDLSGLERGDLFLPVHVYSHPLSTENPITWHRKVLYHPGQVWFSAITCLSSYSKLFQSPDAVFFIVYTLS